MSVDKLCLLVFCAMPTCVSDSDLKARRARFIRFEYILEPYPYFLYMLRNCLLVWWKHGNEYTKNAEIWQHNVDSSDDPMPRHIPGSSTLKDKPPDQAQSSCHHRDKITGVKPRDKSLKWPRSPRSTRGSFGFRVFGYHFSCNSSLFEGNQKRFWKTKLYESGVTSIMLKSIKSGNYGSGRYVSDWISSL